LLLVAGAAVAVGAKRQGTTVPADAELAAITERGRLLAEYDQAAWHASDAVQTANPKTVEGQHYIARKESGRWRVVFGALNPDKSKFVIGYEAEQQAKPKEFLVKRDEPARVDGGFYLFAARALELTLADFVPRRGLTTQRFCRRSQATRTLKAACSSISIRGRPKRESIRWVEMRGIWSQPTEQKFWLSARCTKA